MRFCVLLIERMESVLMVVGLNTANGLVQHVLHISLEREDSVWEIGATPSYVGYGAAACVMDNTLYAVGIGHVGNELWKWNATSDWTRCADMTSGRLYHCVGVVESSLYSLGGWVDAAKITLSSVEAYSTQTSK